MKTIVEVFVLLVFKDAVLASSNIRKTTEDKAKSLKDDKLSFNRQLQDQCGRECSSNDICQSLSGSCNFCNGFQCYNPFVCGNTCNFHSDCSYSQDGCYFCNNGFCSSINPNCGNEKTCVNNNGLFQDALNNPDVDRITICENTILTLRSTGDAFSSGRSGFTVECGGGMCQFIRTAGSGRFLNFSGSGITLVGLYFDNGTGSGTGGAVFIEGFNNRIENCVFRDNTATNGGSGGAVWWGSGTVVGSGGYDNIATGMCDGVFSNNDGSCNDSVNSGTPSQCGRFCTTNSDCNGEQGPCTTCNVNSNRCQVPGSSKTCVSTETMLQDALQDSTSAAPVEICSNANIFLNQQISTSLSNKSLLCQGGARTCTIQRAPNSANFRLLNFSGNNIELTNINFVNGKAPSGDGGAVLLSGTNNIVTNCEFTTNSALAGRGGAMSIFTGTLENNVFSSNFAQQCSDVYLASRGSCAS